MNKRQQSSLYEVLGKTKFRGETYHETSCSVCGAPLTVMCERGEAYIEKPHYCSERCQLTANAAEIGCQAEVMQEVDFTEPLDERQQQANKIATYDFLMDSVYMDGSDTSWKTQLHDAGFGEDGRY